MASSIPKRAAGSATTTTTIITTTTKRSKGKVKLGNRESTSTDTNETTALASAEKRAHKDSNIQLEASNILNAMKHRLENEVKGLGIASSPLYNSAPALSNAAPKASFNDTNDAVLDVLSLPTSVSSTTTSLSSELTKHDRNQADGQAASPALASEESSFVAFNKRISEPPERHGIDEDDRYEHFQQLQNQWDDLCSLRELFHRQSQLLATIQDDPSRNGAKPTNTDGAIPIEITAKPTDVSPLKALTSLSSPSPPSSDRSHRSHASEHRDAVTGEEVFHALNASLDTAITESTTTASVGHRSIDHTIQELERMTSALLARPLFDDDDEDGHESVATAGNITTINEQTDTVTTNPIGSNSYDPLPQSASPSSIGASKQPICGTRHPIVFQDQVEAIETASVDMRLTATNNDVDNDDYCRNDDDHWHAGVYDNDDDDDTITFDFEGTDSDIADAIQGIRREASRVNIVMALDQMNTLRSDLDAATRALNDRSNEIDTLTAALEQKDGHIAKVELERDLFQADVSKLKEDLQTCVNSMFDIVVSSREQDGNTFADILSKRQVFQHAMLGGGVGVAVGASNITESSNSSCNHDGEIGAQQPAHAPPSTSSAASPPTTTRRNVWNLTTSALLDQDLPLFQDLPALSCLAPNDAAEDTGSVVFGISSNNASHDPAAQCGQHEHRLVTADQHALSQAQQHASLGLKTISACFNPTTDDDDESVRKREWSKDTAFLYMNALSCHNQRDGDPLEFSPRNFMPAWNGRTTASRQYNLIPDCGGDALDISEPAENDMIAADGRLDPPSVPQSPPGTERSIAAQEPFEATGLGDYSSSFNQQGRRCGFFWSRKNRTKSKKHNNTKKKKRNKKTSKQEQKHKDEMLSMQTRLDQMHEVMQSSVSSVQTARNRLTFTTRYYEETVQQLRWKLARTRVEKRQRESELLRQISELRGQDYYAYFVEDDGNCCELLEGGDDDVADDERLGGFEIRYVENVDFASDQLSI